jgi:hypothetical protein
MGIKELLAKLGGKAKDPFDASSMRKGDDRYLESLRHQRQLQFEEQEKIRLKAEIETYNKEQTTKNLWGIKDNKSPNPIQQKKQYFGKIKL